MGNVESVVALSLLVSWEGNVKRDPHVEAKYRSVPDIALERGMPVRKVEAQVRAFLDRDPSGKSIIREFPGKVLMVRRGYIDAVLGRSH